MSRITWVRGWVVCAMVVFGCVAAGAASADGKLYLDTGTVDTALLHNLLAARRLEPQRPYVVQLDQPITPQQRRKLVEAGVVLGDYLPKNAFVADLDAVEPSALADLGFVRWVGEYSDEWKLDPELKTRDHVDPQRRELAARGEYPVIVTLFAGKNKDAVLETIRGFDGASLHFTERVGGNETLSVTLTEEQIQRLTTSTDVQYIEAAFEVTLRNNSVRWIVQSNTLNVTPLYDNGLHGEGQIVGVLDGRADQHHCSLDDGKILFYNSPDGNDTHGTHVSGTAVGNNGSDANTRGVAYLANMVFNTTPSFSESGILQRLNLHHSQGARIHTNSWGNDGTTNYDSLARGFDSFLYDHEDDLVTLAVTNGSLLRNPENAKNLLAVGGSFDTPSQASHCTGGRGPTADGRRKPEIYAPGCGITSAFPGSCSTGNLSGTSMATPGVAGVGALVRQYYTEGYYPSGAPVAGGALTPSGALMKATLLNGAVDMTGVSGYPSDLEGWGRLLADNALYFPGDTRRLVVLDDVRNASGLATGELASYSVVVNGPAERLNVTLVFTDPPASAGTGSGSAAVNDLDLEVVVAHPFAETFRGNNFVEGESVSFGPRDTRNNVEQVQIAAPVPAIWAVRIRGSAVNVNRQGFALVVSGDVTVCGNRVLDLAETCDPPGQPAGEPDECRNDCTFCGDSIVNGDEECDDGNNTNGDGCDAECAQGCLDTDLDEICNLADNCPLTPNRDQDLPVSLGQTVWAEAVDRFGWSAPADVEWVVGDLADVGGYGWFGQDSRAAAVSIQASQTPLPGTGYYWLFAPDCPLGSWSSNGAAECQPASACPPGGRDGTLP